MALGTEIGRDAEEPPPQPLRTPALSQEHRNVRDFALLQVAKEVQIFVFFKKGVATRSVSLTVVALCT